MLYKLTQMWLLHQYIAETDFLNRLCLRIEPIPKQNLIVLISFSIDFSN